MKCDVCGKAVGEFYIKVVEVTKNVSQYTVAKYHPKCWNKLIGAAQRDFESNEEDEP